MAVEALDFIVNKPLYEVCEYSDNELSKGAELFQFNQSFDCFCPECGEHSIFRGYSSINVRVLDKPNVWVNRGMFEIYAECSRVKTHRLVFMFIANGKTIQKIGQLPSLASLHLYDVKKYSKVLEKQYFQEFTKAVGLATHGVGVGFFVYLRRIFEALIEDAHQKLKGSVGWNETVYVQSRMQEKIEILANELPDFLVKNKNIYGILSKGIHELSEDECLNAFPIVKLGIELILDERIEAKEKAAKLESAHKAMQALASKI
ncbi:hypothetical protein PVK63_04000 [Aliivibrio sp. S2TY2]|uniref:hypothetical protein n=1 Tax=unclassified Aliivibrio TaxID=2645654 RepID=UPI002379DCE5|nr:MULTISPECIES: hypothetical protein [unclassified Aliivibrio]MDD9174023.1 hypothetical protein [Aliivibrio sp. S3TY1]MDD9191100.1 hypothetical protein [Aliivibrio sp. S2TY2]